MARLLPPWAFDARGPRAAFLLRVVTGAIFVSEGLQKFLFAAELGAGRFAKIGIPMPDVMGPLVGVVEIAGGVLLVVGVATRVVAIPLLVNMAVAITSTKLVTFAKNGFWKTAHEARTDLLMIACLVFLLAVGGGPWSLDGQRGGGGRGGRG